MTQAASALPRHWSTNDGEHRLRAGTEYGAGGWATRDRDRNTGPEAGRPETVTGNLRGGGPLF